MYLERVEVIRKNEELEMCLIHNPHRQMEVDFIETEKQEVIK